MNGIDILKARKAAKLQGRPVSQEELRRKLGLSHRATIVDIEIGRVEVTDGFVHHAIAVIEELASQKPAA